MKTQPVLILFLASLLAASSASAQLYWDTNGTTAGAGGTPTGTWGVDNFWNTDSTGGAAGAFQIPTLGTDVVVFSAGTDAVNPYAISLNSATQNARLVTFKDGSVTLNTGTLSLGNNGGLTVSSSTATGPTISSGLTISGMQSFNVDASRTLTLDTGIFTRNAGATLNVLSTGTVTTTMTCLDAGSLVNGIIGPWASHGSGASTKYATIDGSNNIVGFTGTASTVAAIGNTPTANYEVAAVGTLGAGANINTLRYTGAAGTIAGALTSTGIMNVSGNALTFSGAITGGSGGMVINAANGSIAFTSSVNNGGNMLIFDGAGATSIGNTVLTGAGGLTKSGSGTLSLNYGSGNNPTYGGPTILNGGILRLGGGGSGNNLSGLPTGNITVNGGVFDVYWGNTFQRALGNGTNQIQITGGVSGFSQIANGQTLAIKFGNTNTPIIWGSDYFKPTVLVLNSVNGFGTVDFQNYVNFDGGSRTVEVNAGGSTMSGVLSNSSGTAGLIKTGAGTLVLSTGTANTYNGGTSINQGTLRFATKVSMPATGAVTVNDGGNLGVNLGTAGTVWSNGTSGVGTLGGLLAGDGGQTASQITYIGNVGLNLEVAANVTYSGDMANVGTSLRLIKTGGSSLTLSGNNSYSGGTTLAAGALIVATNTAIPSTGTIRLNGGTIQSNDATARSFTNPVTIGGDFTVGGTGNLTFSNTGASALGATRQITVNTGINATFAQAFSGSGAGLTKAGAGTLTLTGNNTYTGATTINTGTIVLNNDGDVTGGAVSFNGNNTGLTVTGGAGVTSTWNLGGGNLGTTNVAVSGLQLRIDGAGSAGSAVVTNVGILEWGRAGTSGTLLLTDGGQMNVNGEVRTGSTYYGTSGGANITIGGGTATSTFTGNSGQAFYIGYGEREGSNNNVVTVSSGGVLTNVGNMFVGHVNNQQGNDLASTANKLAVTGSGTASMAGLSVGYAQTAGLVSAPEKANANIVEVTSGGTLTTTGISYIGRAGTNFNESNANTLTVSGVGSSWNAGGQTVYVGHTNNAGAQSNNNILTVSSGGALSNINSLIIGFGTGTETGNQVVLSDGSITANTITVNTGNSLLIGTGGGSLGGDITNNGAFDINSAGPVSITGNISGSGGVTLSGAGTTTFSGGNSYAGDTTVSGGTLLVEGYTEPTGLVNVSSGATLGGSGQVGIVTVTDGFFAPGGVADTTLDVNSLTLDPAATLVIGLDDPGLPAWNDLIQISTSFTLAGQINVVPQPGAPGYDFLSATAGTQWLVATYAPGNLVNAAPVTIGSAPALSSGLAWKVDTTTTDGSVFLTVVVPEPASSALLAAGLLVLLLRRRQAA